MNTLIFCPAFSFNRMAGRLSAFIVLLGAALAGTVSQAAVITVDGRITVAADYGTEFIAGDTFDYSFTFDDLTTDTRSETYSAQFQAGVGLYTVGGKLGDELGKVVLAQLEEVRGLGHGAAPVNTALTPGPSTQVDTFTNSQMHCLIL